MRNFSVIRRAPNIVDVLVPLQDGVDTYRFSAATNFDGVFADIQDVPIQGYLDKNISEEAGTFTLEHNRNATRFVFDPQTYNGTAGITDTTQFWLRMTPVIGGVPGTAGPLGLILPHALHTSQGHFNIAGTAPDVTAPNALQLELPWGMQGFVFRTEAGGGDLGVAWDEGAPEIVIPSDSSEAVSEAVQPRMIVRGVGGTADFTATFSSAFPQKKRSRGSRGTRFLPKSLSGLALWLDAEVRTATTDVGSIDPDVSTWSTIGASVSGDSSGYIVSSTTTGTADRRVADDTTAIEGYPITWRFKAAPGTLDWVHVKNGTLTLDTWINVTTGTIGTQTNCMTSIAPVTGGYEIIVTTLDWMPAGDNLNIYGADANDDENCTATIGDEMFTIWDVEAEQLRVDSWRHRPSPTGPVASQAVTASRPGYDGEQIVFDGVDDSLLFTSGFGSHTTHHVFAVISVDGLTGSNQFILDGETGRLIVGAREVTGQLLLSYFEGSTWYATGTTDINGAGLIIVEYQLEAGVGGIIRLNGVAETALQTYTGTAFGSTVAIGARYDGQIDGFLKGSVKEIDAYRRILSTTERNKIYGYLSRRWSL